jgi:hypothetical protein
VKRRDPDNELWASYSKREHDILFHYPERCDGALLHYYLGCERLSYSPLSACKYETDKSLFKKLEDRGYDITTLRFSIKKKPIDTPSKLC